jgi:hypothetical protein
MRPQAAIVITFVLALPACAGSQSTSTSSTPSTPPSSIDGGTQSANPCAAASRPPARLPDGGVNPEACIGVCTLVHHNAPATVAASDAGELPPTGTIDLRLVDGALRREARSLRGCYDSAVLAHPWLSSQGGTVNVHFIVEPNGHVRGRPAASGIDEVPEVANCLESRVRYIVFPAPDGGPAEVAVPFNFEGAT